MKWKDYLVLFVIVLFVIFSDYICVWKTLFHVECFGCGLTRALLKLSELKLYEAWVLNPTIYLLILFIVLQLFSCRFDTIKRFLESKIFYSICFLFLFIRLI